MKYSTATLIFLLAILILCVTLIYLNLYAESSPYKISSKEAKKLIQNGKFDMILDVRTDIERNALGFYDGSVHIQSADLEKIMPVNYPNKNIRILAYCNTGQRSRKATEKLHNLGYVNSVYITSTYKSLL